VRLRSLPGLLRHDDAVVDVLGAPGAVVAVPEPARAFALAGLAQLSERQPLLVAVPTGTDAERLAFDLRAYTGADAVETFPAWETLPFERVSPSVETMGRRLRAMWRLRHGAAEGPRLIVAPVRALIQRLGPRVEDAEPTVVAAGDVLDVDELVERLSLAGYRREYQVEHRGEVAVRGGIVDVYPSTADGPVRIDLWGDEVDRLTAFDVNDQRSTEDLERVEIFACRELLPTPAVQERASLLVGQQPWGRAQWERLAEGLMFDGMESWLPWLAGEEHLLGDLIGPSGGGRPGRHAGPDMGRDGGSVRRDRRLPPAAPALRAAARPHQGAGAVGHLGARGTGHAEDLGHGVGPGGGRRGAAGQAARWPGP